MNLFIDYSVNVQFPAIQKYESLTKCLMIWISQGQLLIFKNLKPVEITKVILISFEHR